MYKESFRICISLINAVKKHLVTEYLIFWEFHLTWPHVKKMEVPSFPKLNPSLESLFGNLKYWDCEVSSKFSCLEAK